ncbi:flavodoxin domain-containing protein [Lacticaseibacillus jixianensis]|uniref:Flavodoxin domain-containing protein n=1 Tax=Lacticaseibacillus jixianensis TaxID=2486012 RepID=A0ABW4BAU4_9LACO|nr:flavodoxin domain-containing protein [Lacticaseibacillus jixianensis]
MGKTVIVYSSQTGFTQGYALWIARVLHCEVLDAAFVTTNDLIHTRLVIYGAHATKRSGVLGFRPFYQQYQLALPQQLIVFGTGLLPPEQVDMQLMRQHTFHQCKRQPQLFYFNGQMDPSAMPLRIRLPYYSAKRKLRAKPPVCGMGAVRPLLTEVDRLEAQGII